MYKWTKETISICPDLGKHKKVLDLIESFEPLLHFFCSGDLQTRVLNPSLKCCIKNVDMIDLEQSSQLPWSV